jgi:hypothetical protein
VLAPRRIIWPVFRAILPPKKKSGTRVAHVAAAKDWCYRCFSDGEADRGSTHLSRRSRRKNSARSKLSVAAFKRLQGSDDCTRLKFGYVGASCTHEDREPLYDSTPYREFHTSECNLLNLNGNGLSHILGHGSDGGFVRNSKSTFHQLFCPSRERRLHTVVVGDACQQTDARGNCQE